MENNVRVHLTAGGLFLLLAGAVAIFWSHPKLLLYVLLVIVAVVSYGALYLILAAWMDPKKNVPPVTNETTRPDTTLPEDPLSDRAPPKSRPPRKRSRPTGSRSTKTGRRRTSKKPSS